MAYVECSSGNSKIVPVNPDHSEDLNLYIVNELAPTRIFFTSGVSTQSGEAWLLDGAIPEESNRLHIVLQASIRGYGGGSELSSCSCYLRKFDYENNQWINIQHLFDWEGYEVEFLNQEYDITITPGTYGIVETNIHYVNFQNNGGYVDCYIE